MNARHGFLHINAVCSADSPQYASLPDSSRKAGISGLTGSIAYGFRVEVCGIPGPRIRGTGAPSVVVWNYAGIGATRRVLSAEARAKIAAAQKKRWAKQKAAAKK